MSAPSAAWQQIFADLPTNCRDPYFQPGYLAIHAAHEQVQPVWSHQSAGDEHLLVAGARHPLSGSDGWDLQSVNGYGGPLATTGWQPGALAEAWQTWRTAQAAAGGVAALFRLHPLLDNARWLPPDAVIRSDRETVYVPVSAGTEAAWQAATPQHRNMVRKAQRLGLDVVWNHPADWPAAANLYDEAMNRLQAAARLRFDAGYFGALQQQEWAELATVHDEHGLAAMAIFLFGPTWSHYHLAARRPDAGNHVGSLLVQAGISRSSDRGLAGCHLGGGRSPTADDPLLRFKRSLGGQVLTFQIAGLILDAPAYARHVAAWTRQAGRAPSWFLGYREPIPSVTKGND